MCNHTEYVECYLTQHSRHKFTLRETTSLQQLGSRLYAEAYLQTAAMIDGIPFLIAGDGHLAMMSLERFGMDGKELMRQLVRLFETPSYADYLLNSAEEKRLAVLWEEHCAVMYIDAFSDYFFVRTIISKDLASIGGETRFFIDPSTTPVELCEDGSVVEGVWNGDIVEGIPYLYKSKQTKLKRTKGEN